MSSIDKVKILALKNVKKKSLGLLAPRLKTELPEYIVVPIESETTCPVRSTSKQEFMAVTLGFWAMIGVLLTNDTSHITETEAKGYDYYTLFLYFSPECFLKKSV